MRLAPPSLHLITYGIKVYCRWPLSPHWGPACVVSTTQQLPLPYPPTHILASWATVGGVCGRKISESPGHWTFRPTLYHALGACRLSCYCHYTSGRLTSRESSSASGRSDGLARSRSLGFPLTHPDWWKRAPLSPWRRMTDLSRASGLMDGRIFERVQYQTGKIQLLVTSVPGFLTTRCASCRSSS